MSGQHDRPESEPDETDEEAEDTAGKSPPDATSPGNGEPDSDADAGPAELKADRKSVV